MSNPNIIDQDVKSEITKVPKSVIRENLIWIFLLLIINLILYNLFFKTGGLDSNGRYLPYEVYHHLQVSLTVFLVTVPIIAFLLGFLVALIPYRSVPYLKRYWRSSLLSILVIKSLISIYVIFFALLQLTGWEFPRTKEQAIYEFKDEYKMIISNSENMFDSAIYEAEKGDDPIEIHDRYSSKLSKNERKIDKAVKDFRAEAPSVGMTPAEFEKVLKSLNSTSEGVIEKHAKLESFGVFF